MRKGRDADRTLLLLLDTFLIKNRFKIHQKNYHQKTLNLMQKGSQNGTKIDAKSHRKSMPKLVTKKIRKIIKNHVSLNGKNIEIHCTNKSFWWFRRLHVRTGKVSNKHQQLDQNPSEHLWKINTKTCSKKACRNHEKTPKRDVESINTYKKVGPKIDANKKLKINK